jgi:EAL domain-containing protein (putative c-di-GMP-specific phosphodiesterase class I)
MSYSLDRIELPAGATLFVEGDVGETAYLIQSGEIEVTARRAGADVGFARLGPGDMTGETALIAPGKRTTSARALTDCVLLIVARSQIEHRLAKADPILRMYVELTTQHYLRAASAREHRGDARPVAPPRPQFRSAIEALSVEADLRQALKSGELVPYFQPIIRFDTRRMIGFEALARWRHPRRGLLLPEDFVPIAETSGLIVDITSWCLEQAAMVIPKMAEAALHNVAATEPLFLSINVSGADLVETPFAARVARMLDSSGVAGESLKIEVTESTLMKDPDRAAASLDACRKLGVRAAIDDFGTGYSSLAYLTKLPVTEIKLAQSFVRSMAYDPPTQKIIKMVLKLADELDLPVVAEGIEETTEAVTLMDMGCAFGQGYLFGRPAPLDQTLHLIRYWSAERAIAPPRRMIARGPRVG